MHTEQKIKPNVIGEAALHSQKEPKNSQKYIDQRQGRREIEVSGRRKGESKWNTAIKSGIKIESENRS